MNEWTGMSNLAILDTPVYKVNIFHFNEVNYLTIAMVFVPVGSRGSSTPQIYLFPPNLLSTLEKFH